MTVSKIKWYNWSNNPDWDSPPYESCSPNLNQGKAWLDANCGGASLGCHGDRAIAGSKWMSPHASGAALDYRADGGWRVMFQVFVPQIIQYSAEFGVQAIHNYKDQMAWHPENGWHAASIGSKNGDWAHIETSREKFSDNTPWAGRIAKQPLPPPVTNYDPARHKYSLYPMDPAKAGLGPNSGWPPTQSSQPLCKYANDVLRFETGFTGIVPGEEIIWTLHSMNGMMNVQQLFHLPINGWVDGPTWKAVDYLAHGRYQKK